MSRALRIPPAPVVPAPTDADARRHRPGLSSRLFDYLDRLAAEIEESRLRSDLADALEDLDPPDPPRLPVYLLLIPAVAFFGFAAGGALGGL